MRWSGIFSKNSWILWLSVESWDADCYDFPNEADARSKFLDNLPSHRTFWPPIQRPETWFEMIFGPSPKVTQFQDISMKVKKKDFIIFILKIIKIFISYLIGSQNFFKSD
jgi:hypothetical protein